MRGLRELREAVCAVNRSLPSAGLVTMHSGNASGIDRRAGRLVIKPSGIDYATLTPEMLVEVDLASGEAIDSKLRPSVDLPHHLYIYRRDPSIGGVEICGPSRTAAAMDSARPMPRPKTTTSID